MKSVTTARKTVSQFSRGHLASCTATLRTLTPRMVSSLHNPLMSLHNPLTSLRNLLTSLRNPLMSLHNPLMSLHNLLTTQKRLHWPFYFKNL